MNECMLVGLFLTFALVYFSPVDGGSCWIHLSPEYAYILSCRIDLKLAGYVQYIKKITALTSPCTHSKAKKVCESFHFVNVLALRMKVAGCGYLTYIYIYILVVLYLGSSNEPLSVLFARAFANKIILFEKDNSLFAERRIWKLYFQMWQKVLYSIFA